MGHKRLMQSLVPIGSFEKKARNLLGDAGFEDLLEFLARQPRSGSVIPGTGGLRKVRFARPGLGKRGGVRVIYFNHSEHKPILLLLIYAKAEREDFDADQASRLRKYVDEIVQQFE